MAQQKFGAAQPVADAFEKIIDFIDPADKEVQRTVETKAIPLPKAWEEANRKSVEQQLNRGTTIKRTPNSFSGKRAPKRRTKSSTRK